MCSIKMYHKPARPFPKIYFTQYTMLSNNLCKLVASLILNIRIRMSIYCYIDSVFHSFFLSCCCCFVSNLHALIWCLIEFNQNGIFRKQQQKMRNKYLYSLFFPIKMKKRKDRNK